MMPRGGAGGKNPDGRDDVWIVDSACTHHTARAKGIFNVTDARQGDPVTLAADDRVTAEGIAMATFVAEGPQAPAIITLKDAFRVPDMNENLMVVGMVEEAEWAVLFAKASATSLGTRMCPPRRTLSPGQTPWARRRTVSAPLEGGLRKP